MWGFLFYAGSSGDSSNPEIGRTSHGPRLEENSRTYFRSDTDFDSSEQELVESSAEELLAEDDLNVDVSATHQIPIHRQQNGAISKNMPGHMPRSVREREMRVALGLFSSIGSRL